LPDNVGPDDEGVVMWVMLQPKICLCEGYRDVRPRDSKEFAFTYMRDGSEVFFALLLRLVHWLIGSSGDGVDDVDHATRGCIACSFGYLPRLKLRWWG
jgi:hypothetical protein